ncbi:MAG TPA: M14 family murein peptide amidase A [Syntrophales bacterium]|nr:M14 family murein peptide amidase A [Syntrophales bacterium]
MTVFIKTFSLFLVLSFIITSQTFALESSPKNINVLLKALESRCIEYGWTDIKPKEIKWEYYRTTQNKYPLIFAQFGSSKKDCILFLGAVHGDELSTVYVLLKFAHYIKDNSSLFKNKCIIIAPLVNPDGFFSKPAQRVNANGIDINRNFPTRDWSAEALRQWEGKYNGNRRYYPGKKPGSEQETLFQIALIKRFKPQKILSVHSPLGFYDFDGPSSDLDSFEHWLEKISRDTNHPLKKYGYFPGSLGNYAGHERDIFTLTLELPSSDPCKGNEYFQQFQTSIVKFINLRIIVYHTTPSKRNPKR